MVFSNLILWHMSTYAARKGYRIASVTSRMFTSYGVRNARRVQSKYAWYDAFSNYRGRMASRTKARMT